MNMVNADNYLGISKNMAHFKMQGQIFKDQSLD